MATTTMSEEAPGRSNINNKPTLADWHADLTANFISSNPASKQAHDEARQVMPGGNTRSVLHSIPFPLVLSGGSGAQLKSVDGDTYLDFVSEYSAAMFGHSHPAIKAAVQEALDDGFNLGGATLYEARLAKHLRQRFQSLELMRFCNSGTEANTMALAAALAFTGRKKILVFDHGYHGGTLSFHSRDSVVNVPHDFVYGTFNNFASLRDLITNDLAAILVEPMQGAGGSILGDSAFLHSLRDAATSVDAMLIFDEVMTSRLAWGGLQGHFGITPDMTTLGKYIGGGFSFGAFGGSKEIMAQFDPNSASALTHSGTFNNNAFSMRAGLAAADILTPEVIERTNRLGNDLRVRLGDLLRANGVESISVTGFGSMLGLHFAGPDAEILKDVLFMFLLEQRIYIGRRGFMALNICHEKKQVDHFANAFEVFLGLLKTLS